MYFLHYTPHVEGGWLMEGLFECEVGSAVDVQIGPEEMGVICSPSVIVLLP